MNNIPLPSADALLRSEQLTQLLREEIQHAGGKISFSRFMELVLYAPSLGYYSANRLPFGKQGDFITAPEISPLFAQCIAKSCQPILSELAGDFLEVGAGSGVFAKDLLLELEKLDSLPKHYFILEISPRLRERQRDLLQKYCPHLLHRIDWIDTFPKKMSGIIFANEVLDAMPVHCFRSENHSILERCVTFENNQFKWCSRTASQDFAAKLRQFSFPNGYESELHSAAESWISKAAAALDQGMLLLLDYGYGEREYYRPDRMHGTLMCFYQHHKHDDPFAWVGLQDITAHVNFTAIAEAGSNNNLHLAGFTTQSAFLLDTGILDRAAKDLSDIDAFKQAQAIKILTLPSEMGELIKALAFTKKIDTLIPGFNLHDRRYEL